MADKLTLDDVISEVKWRRQERIDELQQRIIEHQAELASLLVEVTDIDTVKLEATKGR